MRVRAYRTKTNDGLVNLLESSGEMTKYTDNLFEVFSFLLEPQAGDAWQPQHDRCIRVCWSLDSTVAPLLKLLGEKRCRRILEIHKCYFAPFEVFYIPGKLFSVTHISTHDRVSLYDLEQYFPELEEPEKLIEVQMLGEKLLQELKRMGLEPDKLTSPVAIYEECVMQFLDLPKIHDMPKEVAAMAYQCSGKLWVECHQIGHWD